MVVLAVAPAAPAQGVDPPEQLTNIDKAKLFGGRVIAPKSLAKSAFSAGLNQIDNSPEEWDRNLAGYGRRYGHKLGVRAIKSGIGLLVAMPLQQDPRYFYSDEPGLWRRTTHAVTSTFVTRTDNGGRALSLWRITGNYGAQFASNAWRPERQTGVSDTLMRATVSLGMDAATNIIKEFWPDIRRHVFRRQ